MSECRHEWEAWGQIGSSGIAYIRCKAEGCNERLTTVEVEAMLNEHAALKLAVQAAIDYFTDGITSKEQYDAYLRFIDAAQPFIVVAMATQEDEDEDTTD